MQSGFVTEPEKKIPVVYDVDVVVAGGGVAGIFAAIAAAREGADTVLVERFGYPGGNIGPGMIAGGSLSGGNIRHLCGGFAGIPEEFVERHMELGGGCVPDSPNLGDLSPSPHPSDYLKDANIAVHVALEMLEESGVTCLFSTFIADPLLEGDRVGGVFIENKSGRQAAKARVVVDATGEADLAMRAGAPVIYPQSSYYDIDKHGPGGAGVCYVVAGIDCERYGAYVKEQEALGRTTGLGKGCKGGFLTARQGPERPGHQDGTYGHDGVRLSKDEIGLRMQIFETVQRWKRDVPGFEDAYLLTISPYYGARGGPCIEGEYTVTTEDLKAGRRFPDVLYLFGARAWFGPVGTLRGDDPKREEARVDSPWTDFPYRAMLPKKVDGLLAVGRSASSIPDTILRARMMVMHMGQAGGTAAALAVKDGVSPRELTVRRLQEKLLHDGFYLGDDARLQELGLQR